MHQYAVWRCVVTPEERMAKIAQEYDEPEDAFERKHRRSKLRRFSRPSKGGSRVTKAEGYDRFEHYQKMEVENTRHGWMIGSSTFSGCEYILPMVGLLAFV